VSDYSNGPGWWQASDGKWYPPESAPASTPPPGYPQPDPFAQPGYQQSTLSPQQPAYQPPGAYPQPGGYGYGGPQPPRTDGLAIGSLVSSIVGAVLIIFCFGLAGTIAGFVMGLISRNRIKASNGALTGEGMALAGMIIGGVATVAYLGFIVLFVFSSRFASSTTP
jgi:hypothetical protein